MKVGKPDHGVKTQIKWISEPIFLQLPFVADGNNVRAALEIFEETFQYWQRLLSSLGFIEDIFVSSRDDG